MTIIIGADPAGSKLKDLIKNYLQEKSYDFKDVSDGSDFVDTTLAVVAAVNHTFNFSCGHKWANSISINHNA